MAEPESNDKKNTPESDDKAEAKPAPQPDAKPDAKPEPVKGSAMSGSKGWMLLAAVLVGAGLLVYASSRHLSDVSKVGEALVSSVKTSGKAAIGGPFQLTDHNGQQVSETSYSGKYRLMFFGYTYCPDVCPTGLTDISNALDQLGDTAEKIVPLFVSVDHERDTPEQLREYVQYFHPRMIGLTGTADQIAATAKAYRIYYAKVPSKEPDADPDDYTVDHSALVYLMNPENEFVQHFGHGTTPEVMAQRIQEIIKP